MPQCWGDAVIEIDILHPDQLRNWGRKANLPIYEATASLLETASEIKLAHVKANGDPSKQSQLTIAQCGNIYADKMAKEVNKLWALKHLGWLVRS